MRKYDFSILEKDGLFGIQRLEKKYPFMIDGDYNVLNEMPIGWLNAFGEEMLSDLRAAMGSHMSEFHCLQIKEKWNELVIYFNKYSSEVEKVIYKYSIYSKQFCQWCGLPLKDDEKYICYRCKAERGLG